MNGSYSVTTVLDDFYYGPPRPLDAIFSPKSVAVIGATEKEDSVGRTIVSNLNNGLFTGKIYPVNPNHENILGLKAYPNLAAISEAPELAIIVTPAQTVPNVIKECVEAGVKGAIIISAGFKESGIEGAKLEQQVLAEARKGKLRIIGPNCLGVMNPRNGLNATFATTIARPGNVGFISQSGALCTAVLDWSFKENVGFSAFVSIGSMLDVGWGDLIDYLGDDPRTKSIVIYMESIGDARSFLSAAREVALNKPIIIIKTGRTQAAAQAAASHTGALTGSDEVLDAAFARSGVLRVNSIAELFYMAEILGKQPRPAGPHLTILTNAGGPGVLATDALIGEGGELGTLSDETFTALDEILPRHWSHGNPIDILGDATPERYAKTIEIAAKDPNSNGLLVVLTPQGMTNPTKTAEQLTQYAKGFGKPILASWMGGIEVAEGDKILTEAGIPTFPYPDTAARMFNYMWKYSANLRSLYETPVLPAGLDEEVGQRLRAREIIEAARSQQRTVLTEVESKQILAAYNIPTVETRSAANTEEAIALAEQLGYPVVLKLFSETITHKTDVGGVRLNLRNADEVREAYQKIETSVINRAGQEHFQGVTVQPMVKLDGYELILGSSLDPQFGPVLLFGSGGQLVEVYKDHALALPPLNTTLARRMMEQTRVFTALQGIRGRASVDLAELEQLLVRFSQLVAEQRWIKEIDINPLLASPERFLALDARIILHEADTKLENLPKLAIRPYPRRYVTPYTLKNGLAVTLRPIRPEDEPLLVKFHETLSERTVYYRYFHSIGLSQRVSHERLTRIAFVDYDRAMVIVAEYVNEQGQHEILGVGRLTKGHSNPQEADFAILISDKYQGQGLGSQLLRQLVQISRTEKIELITGDILPENYDMQRVAKKIGFHLNFSITEHVMKAELKVSEQALS